MKLTPYEGLPVWKKCLVQLRDMIQNWILWFPIRRKYRKLLAHAKPRSRNGSFLEK